MSMIICRECGKEISDQAVSCPNCGCPVFSQKNQTKVIPKENINLSKPEKKKDSALSIWACILSLFTCTCFIGLILAIVDLAQNDKTKRHLGSWFSVIYSSLIIIVLLFGIIGTKDTESNDSKIETEDVAETDTVEEDKDYVEPGDTFEVDGLSIHVDRVIENFDSYDKDISSYKPPYKYNYIKVCFEVVNNSDSDKYVSIYDFDCYADGTLCEQVYYFNDDFINANLSSGRNVSYDVYFLVPVRSKDLELEYTENIWTAEKIIIKIH